MPFSLFRAHSCAETSPILVQVSRVRAGAPLLLAATLTGCVSYEPVPVEPLQILHQLEAESWSVSPQPGAAGDLTEPDGSVSPAPGPAELAAFAVTHNLNLKAFRARVGVSEGLLVEAGLLPDPELGWDGMDVLATRLVGETAASVDYLAGLGLSIPLPRPGELDALKGGARWRVEAARAALVRTEWELARAVYLAYEDVLAAEGLLTQNEELTRVVESTDEYFHRAREAGVATAIESSLAHGDLLSIRAESLRLGARVREARQNLNALLGLPPNEPLALSTAEQDGFSDLPESAGVLAERAIARRPDLAQLMANYQAAEADVRLEVARQFPRVSIGTGISITLGLFSHFNRPAIQTAMARRESVWQEVQAAVHEVRREIYDLWSELQEIRTEVDFLQAELLPNTEQSLRLAGIAFEAGEATLVEILTIQRAVVDARTRHGEALAERARRTWQLRAAGGLILHKQNDAIIHPTAQDESTR